MKFKLDENLPIDAALLFNKAGHDAATVRGQQLAGSPDEVIMARCVAEGRAIVTLDLDFADIRTYPPTEYAGVMVVRSRTQDKISVLAALTRCLPLLEREELAGHLWIIEEERVRIRGADEHA
jgi:predicted nuclease of predicted toxin-antitoxin system